MKNDNRNQPCDWWRWTEKNIPGSVKRQPPKYSLGEKALVATQSSPTCRSSWSLLKIEWPPKWQKIMEKQKIVFDQWESYDGKGKKNNDGSENEFTRSCSYSVDVKYVVASHLLCFFVSFNYKKLKHIISSISKWSGKLLTAPPLVFFSPHKL